MMKICIDAGHGGKDAGAVNGGLYEKAAALKVATMLSKALAQLGHTTKLTRDSDVFVELADRCKISNSFGADLFISIHCNSAENSTAKGIETWYCKGSSKGKALATSVQTELKGLSTDRGIKEGTFYVLKHTSAPAILVELGFISNNEEKQLLFKESHQEKLVQAIAKGVQNYLGK